MIYFWENNIKNEAVSITYGNKPVDYVYYASKDNMIWPEELTYTLSNVTVYYSGNKTAILADGSNYAYVQAYAIGRYRDGGDPVVQGTVNLFLIEDSDPSNCFSTQADSGHASIVTANNRQGNEGGVRSATFIGEYLNARISGIEIYQAANTWHYVDTIFDKIWFDDMYASINGGSVLLNTGSEARTRYLVAEGRERYRYDSNTTGYTSSPHVPHAYYDGYTDGNGWLWKIYGGSDYANFDNGLSISRNPSTSSTRDVILYLDNPNDYANKRVTVTIRQSADDYVFKLYDGTPNPYMVEYDDTTTYVYVVSKQGSSRKLIRVNNVSITYNGAMLTAGTVSDYSRSMGEGVYRLSFTGVANNTNSERESTITVTQPTSEKKVSFKIKQAKQGQFYNGIQIISSITVGTDTWLAGTVLLDDGFYAAVVVCKNGTPAHPVKVTISEVRWTDENGSHTDSTIYNIDTGDTITCDTYYAGEQTYKGTDLLDDYTFRSVENLTITRLNISIERADVYTNITVSYYNNDGSTASGDYVPAAGGYALIKGYQGAQQSVMMPTLKQGTDTNVWSVDSSGKIMAGSRGTVTGNVLTAVTIVNDGTQNLEYTISQQANSKSNTVSPGEIEWARVNSDVIYNGDTVSIDNFANTLNITQVSGYRKQYYTSGSFDRVSMINLNNDFRVNTQYGETWISTGTTKFEILVSANTSQISSRSATVTIDDANGYSTNPTLIFTVQQAADSWIFSVDTPSVTLSYSETAFTIYITSKHSGSAYDISAESNWATTLISYPNGNSIGATAKTIVCESSINGQYRIGFECAANTGSSSIDRSTTIRVRQTANENSKYVSTSVSQAKQPAANQVTIKASYGVAQTASQYKIHIYLPGFGAIGASSEYTYNSTSQGGNFTYTISNVSSTVTSQVQGRYDYYSNGQWVEGIPLTSYPTSITVSPGGEASFNLY